MAQRNSPFLAHLPQALPTTQAEWQSFLNSMQAWEHALTVPQWITPTFQNGWSNYDSGTGFHEPAGYYKDASGRVYLRGLVKGGSLGFSYPIFTLPTGYVPAYECIAIADSLDSACSMRVGGISDTAVTPGGVVIASGGSSTWVSLSGISFSTVP